jgi:hypothetical protein
MQVTATRPNIVAMRGHEGFMEVNVLDVFSKEVKDACL